MERKNPRMIGVLETVLYCSDQERSERFYSDVMGFRLIDKEPGRSLFYRAGGSVFLVFCARATRTGGKLPPHGAEGSIHTCFQVPAQEYEAWKRYLEDRGVRTIQEVRRTRGLTFYFEDPDGNLLEIANADIWPA